MSHFVYNALVDRRETIFGIRNCTIEKVKNGVNLNNMGVAVERPTCPLPRP